MVDLAGRLDAFFSLEGDDGLSRLRPQDAVYFDRVAAFPKDDLDATNLLRRHRDANSATTITIITLRERIREVKALTDRLRQL